MTSNKIAQCMKKLASLLQKTNKCKLKEKNWKNEKERILKATRGKTECNLQWNPFRTPIRLSADISAKLYSPGERGMTLKVLKGKYWQPTILYASKLSFRYEGEINFPRQTIAEICLARNTECSLSRIKKMLIKNMKTYKIIQPNGKDEKYSQILETPIL